jgi:hypothetical protein
MRTQGEGTARWGAEEWDLYQSVLWISGAGSEFVDGAEETHAVLGGKRDGCPGPGPGFHGADRHGRGMQVGVVAHSVADLPELASGKEYLEHALGLISDEDETVQQLHEVVPVTLASREFYRADLSGSIIGVKHHTIVFARVDKGHALLIFVGGKNEDGAEEALVKLGLAVTPAEMTGAAGAKGMKTVKAREAAKPPAPDPAWVKEIKLQGISGPEARRLAIINGKTFAPGDGNSIKVGKKSVTVRCVSITEGTAKVTMEGIEGERELRLGW